METGQLIVCMIVGYLFGSIPTGYLYAKCHGVDIMHTGSGNPGSTNALRTMGKKAGASVLCLDILKTLIPIFVLRAFFHTAQNQDAQTLLTLYTGLGVILGHNFPFTMKFHGGKGIACTGATLLAFDLPYALCLLAVFVLVVWVTRYVSVGSLTAVAVFFLSCLFLGETGWMPFSLAVFPQVAVVSGIMTVLAFFMHRGNIKRLMNGTENKFGKKKS